MKKKYKIFLISVFLLLMLVIFGTIYGKKYLIPYFSQTHPSSSETSSRSVESSSQSKSDLPDVSTKDWNLILVNKDHKQEESNPQLTEVETVKVDSRIADALKQFLEAARKISPEQELNSGYRSVEEQKELYNETILTLEGSGFSREDAEREVQKQVQVPGASEHQTGLAVDMSVPSGQEEELAKQISEIAVEYGFILRYPDGKSDITGIDYENWHYRYVGVPSAKYIQSHNLVLEEYLKLLEAEGK
ncbi:M15 family metallopeptidase [Streptococcus sp. DD10]|uniref:M15 family metallopeptidase n=1 Tax=Streptococcus sp. DD10 TaxID=1777878 RepID=UPI00083538D7|nr:M15 family metallopeptidase [Streptococcus sp. DD10]